jgi:hypothetical protein
LDSQTIRVGDDDVIIGGGGRRRKSGDTKEGGGKVTYVARVSQGLMQRAAHWGKFLKLRPSEEK